LRFETLALRSSHRRLALPRLPRSCGRYPEPRAADAIVFVMPWREQEARDQRFDASVASAGISASARLMIAE
jgi:hypothetical protein